MTTLDSIIRAVMSVGIVGAWVYLVVTGQLDAAQNVMPVVLGLLAYWFGQQWLDQRSRAVK